MLWPDFTRKNIFITGGSGFVGSWMLETFLAAERRYQTCARIYVLTRNANAFRANRPELTGAPNITLIEGDVKTFTAPPVEFDYLVHAAVEHVSPAANLEGTRRILEMARTQNSRKLLFTSSGAVYGEQPADLPKLPEDFVGTIRPGNTYAQVKRDCEALCVQSGLNVVIARLFAFVGPHLPVDKNFAIGNFIRDAATGGPIRIEGDGTPLRSYLYAEDLAIWLWNILLRGEPARSYNVGNDQALSILELAQRVEKICGVTSGVTIAKPLIPGEKAERYIPSIDRARTELNLQPLISLDEGILRMFEWYKCNCTSTKESRYPPA